MIESLLLRADAGPRVGYGHLVRCLAVAEEWQQAGGRAVLMIGASESQIARSFPQEFDIVPAPDPAGSAIDATMTADYARQSKAEWVVIDGYVFGEEFEKRLQSAGLRTLAIDDGGRGGPHCANILVDPGLGTSPQHYPELSEKCVVRFGLHYAPLRREFGVPRRARRRDNGVSKILVTFGGADAQNLTRRVVDGLREVKRSLDITVVVGPWYGLYADLVASTLDDYPHKIRILQDVKQPAQLFSEVDFAISAAGTTMWELAVLGVPSIVVITAENQRLTADAAATDGIVISLGCHTEVVPATIAAAVSKLLATPDAVAEFSTRARESVDGQGAARIVDLIKFQGLDFRYATLEDAALLWQWANDNETRKWSFSPAPIEWETHSRWLKGKLDNPGSIFLIATVSGSTVVGQVRFDLESNAATLSIGLDPDYRGRGFGARIIDRAVRAAFQKADVAFVKALVKVGNIPSSRAFAKANFRYCGNTRVGVDDAEIWVRHREQATVSP